MTSRWAAGACFFVALSGCASEPSVAWDSAAAPERAAQAEVELRAFGKGRFEVLFFHGDPESTVVLHDDFRARSLLYRVPFHARVRFLRDLAIEDSTRIDGHIGEPGWAPEGHRDAFMLRSTFGPGSRTAGGEEAVNGAVVFEDLEPGWRFRALEGSL